MRLCLLPQDFDGAGCYRLFFPGRELQRRGHTVVIPPSDEYELRNGMTLSKYRFTIDPPFPCTDIWVLQQRSEEQWGSGGSVEGLQRRGIVVTADSDDNMLDPETYNPAFVGLHPYRDPKHPGVIVNRKLRRASGQRAAVNMQSRTHTLECFRRVDALSVSTPYLAGLYRKYNPNITLIRNYLDWGMWEDVTPQYEVERPRLRVGYMGDFRWRKGDLSVVRDVVPELLRRFPQVDFVATSEETHDYLQVPSDRRVTTGGLAFHTMRLAEITAVMDIGLVPLLLNGMNEGKSHLKGMEYNACGIPFVASPTESYEGYWCDGRNGVLARSDDEWLEELGRLIQDDDLRRGMGRYGRDKASRHTIQEHAGRWEAFYLGLLGDDADVLGRQAQAHGAIQKLGELVPLIRLLREREPSRTVVEIGSAKGGTFWLWCQLAAEDATLVSIDLPGGDLGGVDMELVRQTGADRYGKRNLERMAGYARPGQTVRFIQADSQTEQTRNRLLASLDGRPVDLLVVDGDHRYEGVKRDWELYSPLVDGLVVFHDILPHSRGGSEVDRLWAEVRAGRDVLEFSVPDEDWGWGSWGGLGVVDLTRERIAA